MNAQPQSNQSLSRRRRLLKASQFRETFAQNRRQVGRLMVLWLRTGPEAALRLGVVASKKVGPAVERNRAKRRLREAFRLNRHRWCESVDVILLARHAMVHASWDEIQAELIALAERAGLEKPS